MKQAVSQDTDASEHTVVISRIRPSKSLSKDTVLIQSPTSLQITDEATRTPKTHTFSRCLPVKTSNMDVANELYPQIMESIASGISVSVFAYGSKASGKTHTLFGPSYSDHGVIYHLLCKLMGKIPLGARVFVSHYEVCEEVVLDLLSAKKRHLRIREDKNQGTYIEGLSLHSVETAEHCMELLQAASTLRGSKPQAHVVFQVEFTLTMIDHEEVNATTGSLNGSTCQKTLNSRLCFVDVCASNERSIKHFTLSQMDPSLLGLSSVIKALNERAAAAATEHEINNTPVVMTTAKPTAASEGRRVMKHGVLKFQAATPPAVSIPYRNSVLTWLFRESFGGTSRTIVLACVSGENKDLKDTCATLNFVDSWARVVNHPTPNEDPSVRELMREIRLLRQRLGNVSGISPEGEEEKGHHPVGQQPTAVVAPRVSVSVALANLRSKEEEVALYKARALQAEKDSAERAELLWDAFESLRKQLAQVTTQTREEALRLVGGEQQSLSAAATTTGTKEQEEVEALVEHAAALTIQVAYRRYQYRRAAWAHRQDRVRFETEVMSYAAENETLKLQSMRLYAAQETTQAQVVYWKEQADNAVRELQESTERTVTREEEEKEEEGKGQTDRVAELERLLASRSEELASLRTRLDDVQTTNLMDSAKTTRTARHVDQEVARLRGLVASLETLLDTNQRRATSEREAVAEHARREARTAAEALKHAQAATESRQREVELWQAQAEHANKERALLASEFAAYRETKQREAKETAQEQMVSLAQRSVGGSFLAHYKDSRIVGGGGGHPPTARWSAIPHLTVTGGSTVFLGHAEENNEAGVGLPQPHGGGGEEALLCIKVDVERYDERNQVFHPTPTTVDPADPTSHTYQVRGPLFDLKQGRWSRIRIKVLTQPMAPVEEVSAVMLEHQLPRGRSVLHRLRIVRTERGPPPTSAVVAVTVEWDASPQATGMISSSTKKGFMPLEPGEGHEHTECFCFARLGESGPSVLHATLLVGGNYLPWEFPLRFKSPEESMPAAVHAFFARRKLSDEAKFGYLNSGWFSLPQDSSSSSSSAVVPVSTRARVVIFSGYLNKTQAHLTTRRVQRWFVFAPPFLLCYDSAEKAVMDFSHDRALPHAANRALRIAAGVTKVRVLPPRVPGVEPTEFVVEGEDKRWVLQASNTEDLQRWLAALNGWLAKESRLLGLFHEKEDALMVETAGAEGENRQAINLPSVVASLDSLA